MEGRQGVMLCHCHLLEQRARQVRSFACRYASRNDEMMYCPIRLPCRRRLGLRVRAAGLWPLILLAFALLCELLCRHEDAGRGAAHRLGVRARPVRGRPQLDRDRLHLPGGDAGVARLGRGRPAVALPRRLSRAGRRARLALRPRGPDRARARARRRLGDHRMAARHDVHRLPVEPGRGRAGADAADQGRRR